MRDAAIPINRLHSNHVSPEIYYSATHNFNVNVMRTNSARACNDQLNYRAMHFEVARRTPPAV